MLGTGEKENILKGLGFLSFPSRSRHGLIGLDIRLFIYSRAFGMAK